MESRAAAKSDQLPATRTVPRHAMVSGSTASVLRAAARRNVRVRPTIDAVLSVDVTHFPAATAAAPRSPSAAVPATVVSCRALRLVDAATLLLAGDPIVVAISLADAVRVGILAQRLAADEDRSAAILLAARAVPAATHFLVAATTDAHP